MIRRSQPLWRVHNLAVSVHDLNDPLRLCLHRLSCCIHCILRARRATARVTESDVDMLSRNTLQRPHLWKMISESTSIGDVATRAAMVSDLRTAIVPCANA